MNSPSTRPDKWSCFLQPLGFAGLSLLLLALSSCEGWTGVKPQAPGAWDQAPEPLSAQAGDAVRGRDIVLRQERGNCILCHAVPEASVKFTGDIGPPLRGVGSRLNRAQLRFRLMDASRLNPDTVMPPYHRTAGLTRVAPQYQAVPLLSAQEIEDVVAYLSGLK